MRLNDLDNLSFHELVEIVRTEKSRYNIVRAIGKRVPGFPLYDNYASWKIRQAKKLKKSA